MSDKVKEALTQASSSPDKQQAFTSLLGNIKNLSAPSTISSDLTAIAQAFLSASLGITITREILTAFTSTLKTLDNDELTVTVGTSVLALINDQGPQALAHYIEQSVSLQDLIASAHERSDDFRAAAKVLGQIPLDSSQRRVSNEEKVRVWIRIVRNLLEEEDHVAAETYLNRIKNILHLVESDELNLHFKLSQARINDAKRAFLAASQSYHDISNIPSLAEEERLHTLSMAVKCGILAPAGPLRSRALGRLYKDERTAGLPEFSMLEKMFLDRLLEPAEVEAFASGLQGHQLAKTADGTTVLERAVMEHNLRGVSRLYDNIGFDRLGEILGMTADKAEETTAKMIEQGRLLGRMDQFDRIIWFEVGEASGKKGSGRTDQVTGKEMRRYDARVEALAEEVESVANALQREFPEWVEANLVV